MINFAIIYISVKNDRLEKETTAYQSFKSKT